jgi:hypothetical protein
MGAASSDLTWQGIIPGPRAGPSRAFGRPSAHPPLEAQPWDTTALNRLRDEAMGQYLRAAAGDGVPDLRVTYLPRWWDGASWSACLELCWQGTRWRVVRDDDELVSLPWRAGYARRLLKRRRRPPPSRRLAPLLTGRVRTTPALAAVHVLTLDGADGVRARRREIARRLSAGPDPDADPRQGVLDFEAEPVLAVAPAARAAPRGPAVVVDQGGDWTACRHPACGGMRLLPAPGSRQSPDEVCPSCRRR